MTRIKFIIHSSVCSSKGKEKKKKQFPISYKEYTFLLIGSSTLMNFQYYSPGKKPHSEVIYYASF